MGKPTIPLWQQAASNSPDNNSPTTPSQSKPEAESREQTSTDSKVTKDPEPSDADSLSSKSDAEKDLSSQGPNADEIEDDELIAHGISSSDDADPEPNNHDDSKDLIDLARRFLQDETVKGAPREKKVAFLVSKGVEHTQAEKLVDELTTDEEPGLLSKLGATVFGTSPQQTSPVATTPPPIITYPEFLIHSQPSIITSSRIANIVTGTTATMGAIYGLSKYIISPMTETLAVARHEFFSNARERIENLNHRLSEVVSAVPDFEKDVGSEKDEASNGEGSEDGPPLFYRSVGVQTSPSLLAQTSNVSSSAKNGRRNGSEKEEKKPDLVSEHHERLSKLIRDVSEVSSVSTLEGDAENQLDSTLSSIKGRFYELSHTRPIYHNYPYMHAPYGHRPDAERQDPFWNLKEDIRGLKGSLLSPRSFNARRAAHLRGPTSLAQATS